MPVKTRDFNPAILDLQAPIVFFPVRHHSPAAARLLRDCIDLTQPSAILIEGPADFNDRLADLKLPHQLPIAIYSYLHTAEQGRRGAFYPFCLYSPEWQALRLAFEQEIPVEFIDRPWADLALEALSSHRYGDGSLAQNPYVTVLCQKLGVEDFDGLWDTLFEIDPHLSLRDYLERCHRLCFQLRSHDDVPLHRDRFREAFMVQQIERVQAQLAATHSRLKILVITGGFHSYALFAQLHQLPFESSDAPLPPPAFATPAKTDPETTVTLLQQGIALTPYAYDRLDSLTGYDAGMTNPGFYHQVWLDRSVPLPAPPHREPSYRKLLAQVVVNLREKQQQGVSAADLIAVESLAQALANLRGHAEVWREDLIDGIIAALVKEEVNQGITHPLLQAVYQVFRGNDRGRLAVGTPLPPLVIEIQTQLEQFNLKPDLTLRCINLDLHHPEDLEKSQFLYQLRGLGIHGYRRLAGTDFVERDDLSELWEQWEIAWSPEFEANCIEAAIYGSTVVEAVTNRLVEKAQRLDRAADQAALVLLEACLMGLGDLGQTLGAQLQHHIRQDSNFLQMSRALGHLLYIYRYDFVLAHIRAETTAALLTETFQRSLWLLETLGGITEHSGAYLRGLKTILEIFDRCPTLFADYRGELLEILSRISHDRDQDASLRGGAIGGQWHLGAMETEQILRVLQGFATPEQLGDFLSGLFHLAREIIQRYPDLAKTIDRLIMGYSDQQFLEALPSLRLAFSCFPPREKHRIATGLFPPEESENDRLEPLDLSLNPEVAAAAFALEAQIKKQMDYYGLKALVSKEMIEG
ncbi:MAG: DUF5682 family protein [Prochlorotrichaceae cyanobacterium]